MRYVIIGAGIAGITAAHTLREHAPEAEITVLTDEVHPVGLYDRKALLRRYARGGYTDADVTLVNEKMLKNDKIEILYNPAERIFPARQEVLINHALRLRYDAVLIATGAIPRIVEASGTHYLGVHQMRSYEDVSMLEAWTPELIEQGAVVIGGGILGLEAAWALRQRGIMTTLVIRETHVGAAFLSEDAAQFIEARLAANEVRIIRQQTVSEYQSVDSVVLNAVKLSDGSVLPARMALCAIGTHPNTELGEDAGAAIDDETGALLVNANLQTSVERLYAAGNCAQLPDGFSARHWHEAAKQGHIAALNMLGKVTAYQPAYTGNLETTLYDVPFAYFGAQVGTSWIAQTATQFAQVWLAGERITGVTLLGEATHAVHALLDMAQAGQPVPDTSVLRELLQAPAAV